MKYIYSAKMGILVCNSVFAKIEFVNASFSEGKAKAQISLASFSLLIS